MALPTLYQQFIHKSRYARYLPNENRRENWDETVKRYFDFFEEHLKENNNYTFRKPDREELENAVLNLKVMPSMRALMTAGPALKRENVAGYNCSYRAVDSLRAFDEILYILMCGTGVGFSVENKYVSQLPEIADEFHYTDTTIVVPDSKLGWAKSLKELLSLLVNGLIPQYDLSKLRPEGAILKTFGGRSSGPEPLRKLFDFSIEIFKNAAGRKLNTLECHDLVCMIGEIVVSGGVRRSALISLSDLGDDRLRNAKSGQWWELHKQRQLSNNSAVYTDKPDIGVFMEEWLSLYNSKSGERGLFSRVACKRQAEKTERRNPDYDFGTNPCSEIILRNMQFCNLTEVVARPEDDLETLKEKVRLATILGTLQSTLTNFKYISKKWTDNCEEERLLGVSITGIMDNPILNGTSGLGIAGAGGTSKEEEQAYLASVLDELRKAAIETNKEWAKRLGINQSVSITCVKPSGTVSQLVNSASGIHARHADYYIRNVHNDKKDPITDFLMNNGFDKLTNDYVMNDKVKVISFPMKSPDGCITRNDMTAIEQLEMWLVYQNHWCEHKPSVTISVKEHEWLEVGAWVYEHFDQMSGVSFLPHTDHIYEQAPYMDCTQEEYEAYKAELPESLDWDRLVDFEEEDMTTGTRELACVAGVCEI